MPKVSIIVPVYKVENYLERCLKSIMQQTLEDIEIIVADEGDQDRCWEIISNAAAQDPRIVTLHEKHGGYGNSVNAGIDRATGEYIGFVESDDFIEPNMYELLYAKGKELDADIVKSPFFYYYNESREHIAPLTLELCNALPKDQVFTLEQYPVMVSMHPSIWSAIYKAEWLKDTGIRFLEKGAYLDIRFRFETLMSAKRIAWIDDCTYHWRRTNPTSTNAVWNLNAALERWEFLHDQFRDKPDLWKIFAPYMIREEYLNLFSKYSLKSCTSAQRKKIREYRALYSDIEIELCPFLNDDNKKFYLRGNLSCLAVKRGIRKLYDWVGKDEFEKLSIAVWFAALITGKLVAAATVLFALYWGFLAGVLTLRFFRKI